MRQKPTEISGSGSSPDGRRITSWLRHRLIKPSPHIVEADQRRQAGLLSAFLLVIIGIAALLEIVTIALTPNQNYTGYRTTIGVVLVLAVLYGVSRTRFFGVAAILAVIVASLGTFAAGLADSSGVRGGLLDFLIISIWCWAVYI